MASVSVCSGSGLLVAGAGDSDALLLECCVDDFCASVGCCVFYIIRLTKPRGLSLWMN